MSLDAFADEATETIVFQADEWLEDDREYGSYAVCLGGLRMHKGKMECVRVATGIDGLFGERVESTTLPLQVFIEKREGSAVNIEYAGPISSKKIRTLDGNQEGSLEVRYSVDIFAAAIDYEMPSRTSAQIKWDVAVIDGPKLARIEPPDATPLPDELLPEDSETITFSPEHFYKVENDDYQGYVICLGGMRWHDGKNQCVKPAPGFGGLFQNERELGTILPLQVFIEKREGSAIVLSSSEIIDTGSREKLKVVYKLNEEGDPLSYVMSERTKEHIKYDDYVIDGPPGSINISTAWVIIFIGTAGVVGSGLVLYYRERKTARRNQEREIATTLSELRTRSATEYTARAETTPTSTRSARGGRSSESSRRAAPSVISSSEPEEVKVVKNKRKVIL